MKISKKKLKRLLREAFLYNHGSVPMVMKSRAAPEFAALIKGCDVNELFGKNWKKEAEKQRIKDPKEIKTIGDLKALLAYAKKEARGEAVKGFVKEELFDLLKDSVPGLGAAKSIVGFIKDRYDDKDGMKSGTALDFMNVDDNISLMIDDKIEELFLKRLESSLSDLSDDSPLEKLDMNNLLSKFLAGKYDNRTVTGFNESFDNRKSDRKTKMKKLNARQLRNLIKEELNHRPRSKKQNLVSIIFEQEEATEKETKGLVDINAGPDAVLAAAAELIANPQTMKAGETDAAGPGDETFEITPDSVPASSLEPTQNAVGSEQSLKDQAGDNWGNLDRAIAGGKLKSKTGEFPILVYKNKILDGHHRWSQFMATNPTADVSVARLEAPGVKDEEGALGLAHFINFALYGKSPTKDFEGDNVYGMNEKALYDAALGWMSETTPQKLADAGLIDEPTAEAAAKHLSSNMANLPAAGSHPRTSMPQSADAGDPTGLTQTPPEVAAGAVNYLDPQKTDVKEANNHNKDNLIMERWRALAGLDILKD